MRALMMRKMARPRRIVVVAVAALLRALDAGQGILQG